MQFFLHERDKQLRTDTYINNRNKNMSNIDKGTTQFVFCIVPILYQQIKARSSY